MQTVAQTESIEHLDEAGFFPKDSRPVEEAFGAGDSSHHDALGFTRKHKDEHDDLDERPVSTFVETSMLFYREFLHHKRDTASLFTKYFLTLFLGVLIGVIFLDVGASDTERQSVSYVAGGSNLSLVCCRRCSPHPSAWCWCFGRMCKVDLVQWSFA